MSVKDRGTGWGVWVYDPAVKDSVYLRSFPKSRDGKRQADALFAAESERRAKRARGRERAADFARRWVDDYPRRSERTNRHNRERLSAFIGWAGGRYLDEVTVPDADEWARANRARVPTVRAMFNEARRLGLVEHNPFAKLGLEQSAGRKNVEPPTVEAFWELADLMVDIHGDAFGWTLRGACVATAFVGWRPSEMTGAWWSDIGGDEIDVLRQWNPRARSDGEDDGYRPPKWGSTGRVYLPDEARQALARVPRRVGDPVMFRTLDGAMLAESTLHYWLDPVRLVWAARGRTADEQARRRRFSWYQLRHFCGSYLLNVKLLEPWMVAEQLRHKDGGVLVQKLYGHPSARVAREQIRRAFGSGVRPLDGGSGASRERGEADSA